MSEIDTSIKPELDLETGLVTYLGVVYTLKELEDLWEQEEFAEQDRLEELRDFTRDDQNLWGSKKDGFRDNWYGRKKPQKRKKGYPRDVYP